jgi:hypothetical protein
MPQHGAVRAGVPPDEPRGQGGAAGQGAWAPLPACAPSGADVGGWVAASAGVRLAVAPAGSARATPGVQRGCLPDAKTPRRRAARPRERPDPAPSSQRHRNICAPPSPAHPHHQNPTPKAMSALDDDATLTQLATAWVGVQLGGAKVQEASYIYQELGDKYTWTVRARGGAWRLRGGWRCVAMRTCAFVLVCRKVCDLVCVRARARCVLFLGKQPTSAAAACLQGVLLAARAWPPGACGPRPRRATPAPPRHPRPRAARRRPLPPARSPSCTPAWRCAA